MMISPIGPIAPGPMSAPAAKVSAASPGFSDAISKGLESVAGLERTADQTVSGFATGGSVQIQDVMTATAKANLGMQVMVELRNKALDAYQQIMNIQV
jgi:flagellar hook-basal body complex protein FliE